MSSRNVKPIVRSDDHVAEDRGSFSVFGAQPTRGGSPASSRVDAPVRPEGRRFNAEFDLAEIDDRGRPTMAWAARGVTLSTSNLVIRSRRMSYLGRTLFIAIHLIDSEPVPLAGQVFSCTYDADGMYLLDIDLISPTEIEGVTEWALTRVRS